MTTPPLSDAALCAAVEAGSMDRWGGAPVLELVRRYREVLLRARLRAVVDRHPTKCEATKAAGAAYLYAAKHGGASDRLYWLFTETFCELHGGKDYCDCADAKRRPMPRPARAAVVVKCDVPIKHAPFHGLRPIDDMLDGMQANDPTVPPLVLLGPVDHDTPITREMLMDAFDGLVLR